MKKRDTFKLNYKKLFFIVILLILIISTTWFLIIYFRPDENSLSMVSGTEYISGEEGQVIARVANRQGSPISGVICSATLFFPDKSYFILERQMQEAETSGNYFITFTVPQITGVYEYNVECIVNDELLTTSKSFHVSPAFNMIEEMSKMNSIRHQEVLFKINETKMEILNKINDSFNEDLIEYIDLQTIIILENLENKSEQTKDLIEQRFLKFREDMVLLGNSISEIFE